MRLPEALASDPSPGLEAMLRYLQRRHHVVLRRLAFAGTPDQVAEQATELARAFQAAGNRNVTLRVLPATNHLFLPDSSGDPAGYPALAVHAIPSATLGIIADWLVARLRP